MSVAKLLVAIAFVISAVTAYLLQSGPEERIAMLVRDGRNVEAVVEIERLLATGTAKPRVLMTLAMLQDTAGDRARAADLMELYVLSRPRDRDALAWLVRSYEAADDVDGLIEAQAKLAAVDANPVHVAKLVALHRFHGRFAEECAALESFAERGALTPDQTERLAQLLAAEGRMPRAVEVLRGLDEHLDDSVERPRRFLFELLIDQGRYAEAAERAKRWLAAWRKPWLAAQMTLRLATKAPLAEARGLAQASAILHPDAQLYLAKSLAEQGNRRLATALLLEWPYEGMPLNKPNIDGYVAAAAATGIPTLIWSRFALLRSRPAETEAQALFAEAIAAEYGLSSIALLQPALPDAVLRRRPLFAARLALHLGQQVRARLVLAEADLDGLPPAELAQWLDLVMRLNSPQAAFATLQNLEQRMQLPESLHAAYRALATQLGRATGPAITIATSRHLAGIPR
ncbi:tetratricopeptide repeat protein [Methylobacterium oxalidis]|uniref:Uncharacterized protein n=1 Tax=Methylobacterium oxalidis TaxID=944322 RepID=A0A512J880_9HYPH|nr:hypothetical protein [Methylobacterium oxalidis]GEP06079.1 hypothetical protein MOX02_41170 [Methylobacterium oxalidis]GJE31831.1 hypothetical protein LDDCCGHA_2013 [Methylobacterium oxalidis]GLS64275.1 hypothetical protein GCM10007888_26560 [Methylobacterium oxalidis]